MSKGLNLQSVSALLTTDILQQVVGKIYSNKPGAQSSTLLEHTVEHASKKGEGYLGIVYRISLKLSDESVIHIIGKGMPHNIVRRKTFECELFFANEIYFFDKVLPAFRELELKQRGAKACQKDSLFAFPECYYTLTDGTNDFLLLQDLCEEGYISADRQAELGNARMEAILRVIARLHAFSYALKFHSYSTFQSIVSGVNEIFLNPGNEKRLSKYMHNLALLMYRAVKNELENTNYLRKYEKFIEEENFYKNMMSSAMDIKEPAVINHGDCWIQNFMFTADGKTAKGIDLQIIRYGSPVLDLALFIFSSTTLEELCSFGGVRNILQIYHRELLAAVQALSAPVSCAITWEELCEHWKQCGVFGLSCAIELVPLTMTEEESVQDLDRVEGTEAVPLEDLTQFKEITNELGKKRLAGLIKLAVDEGML